MSEEQNPRDWIGEFQIQSSSDLDFVIGQQVGWPIGMTRSSPPEFRRRVLAAAISHQLGLRSIDYAMKRYVKSDQYEGHKTTIGDSTSDFLREAAEILKDELKQLHTQENLTFGRFEAEITLFKFPEILDLARMLANRGLFLEVLPILRLCLEMTAWSVVSFDTSDEEAVRRLKAHKCVPRIKAIYESAGQVLENHLRHEPRKTSRSRIKRLRGVSRPQFRLRVGEVRVFYDVSDEAVEVLAVVEKSEAILWLAQFGKPE